MSEPPSEDGWECDRCGHFWTESQWDRLEAMADDKFDLNRELERYL
jgi:uncharacterized protein with PIN domain